MFGVRILETGMFDRKNRRGWPIVAALLSASGGLTSPVDDFIKGSISGAPVVGPAERDLIRDGWKKSTAN